MPKAESEKHPAVKVGRRPGFPVCSVAHTRICDQRQYPDNDLLPQEIEICIWMFVAVLKLKHKKKNTTSFVNNFRIEGFGVMLHIFVIYALGWHNFYVTVAT